MPCFDGSDPASGIPREEMFFKIGDASRDTSLTGKGVCIGGPVNALVQSME